MNIALAILTALAVLLTVSMLLGVPAWQAIIIYLTADVSGIVAYYLARVVTP